MVVSAARLGLGLGLGSVSRCGSLEVVGSDEGKTSNVDGCPEEDVSTVLSIVLLLTPLAALPSPLLSPLAFSCSAVHR